MQLLTKKAQRLTTTSKPDSLTLLANRKNYLGIVERLLDLIEIFILLHNKSSKKICGTRE